LPSLHELRPLVPCVQPSLLVQELLLRDIFSDAVEAAFEDFVWEMTRTELAFEIGNLHQILLVE